MPDPRHAALVGWGEELRRHRSTRRGRRSRSVTVAAAGLIASLGATLLWPPRPALLWNGSASSPVGLYHVTSASKVERGDMVVAWPPDTARRLAAERRYLPANVPFVKHVAAARDDRVCAAGEAVFVNGQFLALRRREDTAGRPLPWWTGCTTLEAGEFFLLMAGAEESFDGRYFGITDRRQVIGRARLLWEW